MTEQSAELPLQGIRVVELSHMVMGPSAGLILGDLGADVIKVEPVGGDHTRQLTGSGAGYFAMYNRNKRSIALNLKSPEGIAAARKLIASADVVVENFRPGAVDKLGLDYTSLSADNPRLIYCSARGFLSGPYEHRTALDEVAQMMGGLAYMTGPPGRPLRAGASVIDVMGGVFGVVGILAALEQRQRTGCGQQLTSSLFESTVFLMGQHMAQYAVTGQPAAPMPTRISAWAIYDVFETADADRVFVGVVSDTQWLTFCRDFGLEDFLSDQGLRLNRDRVAQRDRIMPVVRALFLSMTRAQLAERLERSGLPFAPIAQPEQMFDDPHLQASGGLVEVTLSDGSKTQLPALPVQMQGQRLGLRRDLPAAGEHTHAVLRELGYDEEAIAALQAQGVAGEPPE